jgi:hypothetical protein
MKEIGLSRAKEGPLCVIQVCRGIRAGFSFGKLGSMGKCQGGVMSRGGLDAGQHVTRT